MCSKHCLLILFLALITCSLTAQQRDLISSRRSSYYRYIYKITNQEARKINSKSISKLDYSCLHTIVDSLSPNEDIQDAGLSSGNYLEVKAIENNLSIEYFNICDYTLQILDNKRDLCIQLLSKGDCTPVPDAEVWIKNTRIHFDEKTQSYRLKTTDKKGLLTIKYKGISSFFRVGREYPFSYIKRIYYALYAHTPLRYFYKPVYNLVTLPYYSFRRLSSAGYYQNPAWQYFRYKGQKIASLFNPDLYFNDYSSRSIYNGYLVFSKPMYRPGDTIKLKAFITNNLDGRPYDGKVSIYLKKHYNYYYDNNASLFLKEIISYAPGGYSSQIVITDSLKMILDNDYEIVMKKPGSYDEMLVRGDFRYSDYELKRNTLKVSVDKTNQWRGEPFIMHVMAKDDNGNAVPDCRVEIKLKTKMIYRFDNDRLFIPIYLLEKTFPLVNGRADIVIPDSIFPEVRLSYDLMAKVISADNEKMNWDTTVIYETRPEYLSIKTKDDSIHFSCSSFGLNKEVEAEITGYSINEEVLLCKKVTLPYVESLNRLCSRYEVTSIGIDSESLDMETEKPQIEFFGDIEGDSLIIASSNPRKILFTWFLFNGNNLFESGSDQTMNLHRKCTENRNYTFTSHFTWAGKERSEILAISDQPNKLNIDVQQPQTIYPGQSAEVKLTVTDSRGKAVSGVDLTCYGITHKFGDQSVSVPSYVSRRPVFQRYNSFHLKDSYDYDGPSTHVNLKLNYPAFRERYGLDTIEYYHFLYPGDSIYTYSYPADDEITQVAPYIVNNGEVQPIRVLYIDSQPYYFNWVDVQEPYSFRVSSGLHTFRFILRDEEIKLTSVVDCKRGHKTLFSLDEDGDIPFLTRIKRDELFSKSETENLAKYVFSYKGIKIPGKNAYLQQYQRIIPLLQEKGKSFTAGPLNGDLTWFRVPGQLEHNFEPEPGFEYEFLPGVIKMRSRKPEQLIKSRYFVRKDLQSQVYTVKKQIADDNALMNSIRRNYKADPDIKSRKGNCKLQVELNDSFNKGMHPLNILLINCDSTSGNIFLNGEKFSFTDLNPSRYCLMLLFEDDSYFFSDTIYVRTDGINYLKINAPERFRNDSIGKKVSETIIANIWNKNLKKELGQQNYFRSLLDESDAYTGSGFICQGKVVDKNEGEPIPFVMIIAKGTKYGTTTDFDGNFKLKIPDFCDAIVVSYVGYKPATIKVLPSEFCLVELEPSATQLEAVEIVDYRVPLISKDNTASGSTITSDVILKMPSRNVSSIESQVSGVYSEEGEVGAIRGQREDGSVLYIDGIRVRGSSYLDVKLADDFNIDLINSKKNLKGIPTQQMPEFFSSIRNRFDDCAYWEPMLRTDENGRASFKVKFPDDITRWDTYVLAMNDKKQSGIASAPVFSYKPLIAQLYIPRFIVEGDTVKALGKTINYTKDTLSVRTSFELDGVNYGEHESSCSQVVIDSMFITASHADTLKVKYLLTKSDGYFDGEIRDLPVKPFGVEESEGFFMMFDHDTTLTLPQGPGGGAYQISADADYLEVMKFDLSNLHYYPYLCNEQLASKLRGLLAERMICKYRDEKFKGDKDVNKIIGKLLKNQNEQHGWGWWEVSQSVPWISTHVITTLLDAREAGYAVNLNIPDIIADLVYLISKPSTSKLDYLYLLNRLGADVNYTELISKIENGSYLTISQKLLLTRIKQAQNLPYSIDSLMNISHRTMFGNYYWGNENQRFNLLDNTIEATIQAYRILEKDSIGRQYLPRIRAYLLSQRRHYGWMNTYQCASIIETLLPSMLSEENKTEKPNLIISGPVTCNVKDFPFTTSIESSVPLKVSVRGNNPVYFTAFSKKWNPVPAAVDSLFHIETELIQKEKKVKVLKAAESTILRVKVNVKKPAEYVKIEVPIPAGCSYDEKSGWYPGEQYREQYRDRTVIFCNKLNYGSFTFDIKLLPRYTGSFSLLPAVAEQMYFPIFFGRNESERVKIGN